MILNKTPDKEQHSSAQTTRVYLVASQPEQNVNDRVRKLILLRDTFARVTLVTPGKEISDEEQICAPKKTNPTGLLRVLGQTNLKKSLDKLLFFPSTDILFVKAIKKSLIKRVREDIAEGYGSTVLIAMPSHALGALAKDIKAIAPEARVVLDWQDLWSYDPNYFDILRKPAQAKALKWEKSFFSIADLNITTNSRAASVLTDHFAVDPKKVTYIEHHYHEDDFGEEVGTSFNTGTTTNRFPKKVLKLGFLGTLDKPPRVPGLELVELLCNINQQTTTIELHVHGLVPSLDEEKLAHYEKHGIFFHGTVPHEQSGQAMKDYDAVVLLLADSPNSRVVFSIKLPHYLQLRKPILAIVPKESANAEVVSSTGCGVVVDSSADWRSNLSDLFTDLELLASKSGCRNEETIQRFDWKNIKTHWIQALSG